MAGWTDNVVLTQSAFNISQFVNAAYPLPSPCNLRIRGMVLLDRRDDEHIRERQLWGGETGPKLGDKRPKVEVDVD